MLKVLHHAVQWMKKNKICNCNSKQDQTFLKITQTCYIVWVKLIFKHNIQYVSSGSSRLLVLFLLFETFNGVLGSSNDQRLLGKIVLARP